MGSRYNSGMQSVLVFDGDCGFCQRCARLARRWVRPRARIEAWQSLDLADLGLTADECAAALQWVGAERRSGGRAVAAVLRAGVFPWPILGAFVDSPVVRPATDAVYRWVARHRHQLPGAVCSA
jgi:predicted DCC family thiol-disulfide oxidoreductase YuxK